jgi:SAM-dependent methyltransferase
VIAESWPADAFEALYRERPDPWGFESSPYEQAKLAHLLDFLPHPRFAAAVEIGCAIGVSTAALAQRCDRLLAIDAAEAALQHARHRCAPMGHVSFLRAYIPAEFPPMAGQATDLLIVSELLYFLSPPDIDAVVRVVLPTMQPDGTIVLANWTGPTDTPCTGDQAAERFILVCQQAGWHLTAQARQPGYRLDRLERASDASAAMPAV